EHSPPIRPRGPFSCRPGKPLSAFQLAADRAPGSGREAKFESRTLCPSQLLAVSQDGENPIRVGEAKGSRSATTRADHLRIFRVVGSDEKVLAGRDQILEQAVS